jgi:uncharacterized 2Fe-2S/4Fe-4S cluster protein (DUF4445 family)
MDAIHDFTFQWFEMHKNFYVVTADGQRKISCGPGETLARALFRAGFFLGAPLCAGLGRCGRCRARFLEGAPPPRPAESRRLTPGELAAGFRLTCLHPARGGERLVVDDPGPSPAYDRPAATGTRPGPVGPLGLAVDLGTTGLAWRLLGLEDGVVAAEGRGVNPQLGAGGEVISRLAFALEPGGGAYLRELVLDVLVHRAAEAGGEVTALCVAGNAAMVSILCDRPLTGLARAPYHLDWRAGEMVDLGRGLPPAYIPPLLGPFVGADLSAGLTALLRRDPVYPFLLADLGTNAELVLGLAPDRFLAASAPLGPALEGVGLSQGGLAGPGVAVDFALAPYGLVPVLFDDAPPSGPAPAIAGPGYLALVARLLEQGVLDSAGQFVHTPAIPLAVRLAAGVSRQGGEACFATGDYRLWASDVEELLKVKAACNLAVAGLLHAAGLTPADLATVHLAGAFGARVSPGDLETLGFFPPGLARRTRVAGNLSLEGAGLFLWAPSARLAAEALPERTAIVPLTTDGDASEAFIHKMVFAYVP